MSPPKTATAILKAVQSGDPKAADALFSLVYAELRVLASSRLRAMRNPARMNTLQTTALVHEAYLKLMGGEADKLSWESRAHFFGSAARAMQNILVDRVRRKGREKHGGGCRQVAFHDNADFSDVPGIDYVELEQALRRLTVHDPRKHEVVLLKFFGGLDIDEIASTLQISAATVKRDWEFAKAWLLHDMSSH
ncbi:MAG: sigma-70 family RNA polymerase sigma factor [Pyrinomonadaceae bacterium]|nr:sigma-70 family RNA polymerase sigma factor [Phycisphaerales bacterium]